VKDYSLRSVYGFVVKLLFIALAGFATVSIDRGQVATASIHPQPARQRSEEVSSEIARLNTQLNSSDEEERRSAVLALSALETLAARESLVAALQDRSDRVRAAAITGLGRLDDPSLATIIAPLLSKDKSAFVRKSAAYAIGRLRSPAGTAALVAALGDKEFEVRGAAAVALGEYSDAQAVGPLIRALSDKSEFVRAHAAHALGGNGRAAVSAVPSLIRMLTSDPDLEPKRQAAYALGQIGDPSALHALRAAVRANDPHLSSAALTAIENIKN
jgi:HEAT repeat protein